MTDASGAANEPALLILWRPRGLLRIECMDELGGGKLDAPFGWLLLGRFHNAELLDSSFRLSRVEGAKFAGIAGPRVLGAPFFSYVLLLLIGWMTLATPILVRVSLSDKRQLTLEEARTYISKIVKDSELLPDARAKLSRRIERTKSIADMVRAINDVWE